MDSRERILAALNGREMDRVPLTEIGIWPETLQRWHKEGLPNGITPHDYFGLDKIEFFSYDTSLGLHERTISQDKEFRIYTDGDGSTYKLFANKPSWPHFLSSSVTSAEDWKALRGNLIPNFERFANFNKDVVFGQTFQESQQARYEKCKRDHTFTVISPLEPCWYYLRLLGDEEALATIALDPDFAGMIIENYNNFTINMLETILKNGYRFDALWVFSDLSYKNGMLFSPRFYRENVMPHQKRLFDLAKENGMKVIYHSDGNIRELLPLLIEAGIDCIQPLEVRAGNDVREYLAKYPKNLSFIGNINMDIFSTTKQQIEDEVTTKILAAKDSRRYIFHSDHSVPDLVSFENYSFAIKVAKSIAGY